MPGFEDQSGAIAENCDRRQILELDGAPSEFANAGTEIGLPVRRE